jgi:hypothetical protein
MQFRLCVAHIQPLAAPRQGERRASGKRDGRQTRSGYYDHPHRLVANIEARLKGMPTPRPVARPVVQFVGRVGSNVFIAHLLIIGNVSQHRCSLSSIAYGCAEQAGESVNLRRPGDLKVDKS